MGQDKKLGCSCEENTTKYPPDKLSDENNPKMLMVLIFFTAWIKNAALHLDIWDW